MSQLRGETDEMYAARVARSKGEFPAFLAAEAGEAGSAAASSSGSTTAPSATGRDIGDEVADRMDAHLGRKPTAVVAPVTTSGPRDLGDEVADRMELHLFGAVRG